MKRAIRTAIAATLASVCLCANARAELVTIDVPGSNNIQPIAINDKGQVAGSYEDSAGIYHGFLWKPDGTLATFEIAGAAVTFPKGISAAGVIDGTYGSAQGYGAFVRAANGTITAFTLHHSSTGINGVNAKGWSVGGYSRKPQSPFRSFLRSPSGGTRQITLPGGASGQALAEALNNSLTVTGEAYIAGTQWQQAFVRAADGTGTVFGDPQFNLQPRGINDSGTIAGWYETGHALGFVRTSDGTITTFDNPNGSNGTFAWAINNSGTIAGYTAGKGSHQWYGFVRTADGTFTTVDPQGSAATQIYAINNNGAVTGNYLNRKDARTLGFAGTP